MNSPPRCFLAHLPCGFALVSTPRARLVPLAIPKHPARGLAPQAEAELDQLELSA